MNGPDQGLEGVVHEGGSGGSGDQRTHPEQNYSSDAELRAALSALHDLATNPDPVTLTHAESGAVLVVDDEHDRLSLVGNALGEIVRHMFATEGSRS